MPAPDKAARLEVLQVHTRAVPMAADVDLALVASATDCFTGAELASLVREAALNAMRLVKK